MCQSSLSDPFHPSERELQIKIAPQLGHNVQSLALIRTQCVHHFQKQLPRIENVTRAGTEKKRLQDRGLREEQERKFILIEFSFQPDRMQPMLL